MKRFLYFLTFIGLVLSSCKKENNENDPVNHEPEVEECYERTFYDTILAPAGIYKIDDYLEDGNFDIVYAWTTDYYSTGEINLTKLDTNLNEIWSNSYSNISGTIENMLHDDENNIILITHEIDYDRISSGVYYAYLYFQSGMSYDTCAPVYFLNSDTLFHYVEKSKSYIYKFNVDGDLLWEKEIDYSTRNGHGTAITNSGDIIIGTHECLYGNYEPVYRDGVFQDTMLMPDTAVFHLSMISNSGELVWEKELEFPTFLYDQFYLPGWKVPIHVSLDNDNIYASVSNAVYTYDMYGEMLDKSEIYDHCQQLFTSCGNMLDNEMIVVSSYIDPDKKGDRINFLGKFNTAGSLSWLEEVDYDGFNILDLPDGNFIYVSPSSENSYVSKYDKNGQLLWRNLYNYRSCKNIWPTCNSGFLLLDYNSYWEPGIITAIRTDENGAY